MAQGANPYNAPRAAVGEIAAETEPARVFSVSGRLNRVRYIAYGIGFYFLFAVIGGILAAALGPAGGAAFVLAWIVILVIGFMLTIQRCHDFNTSGWLSLLMLVPLVNFIFWFIPGTDGPNRYGAPNPPNSGGVIAVVLIIPVGIVVIGILAAIALPAYQDYTQRARVAEVLASAGPWRTAVTEHFFDTGKLPENAAALKTAPADAGSRHGKVTLGANGLLTLTMAGPSAALADKTIELRPQAAGKELQWDCKGGSLPPKYRPASCRGQ